MEPWVATMKLFSCSESFVSILCNEPGLVKSLNGPINPQLRLLSLLMLRLLSNWSWSGLWTPEVLKQLIAISGDFSLWSAVPNNVSRCHGCSPLAFDFSWDVCDIQLVKVPHGFSSCFLCGHLIWLLPNLILKSSFSCNKGSYADVTIIDALFGSNGDLHLISGKSKTNTRNDPQTAWDADTKTNAPTVLIRR